MTGVRLEVPADALEAIVAEVTSRVRADLAATTPWMTRPEAAGYLRVPVSRLEKDRSVPSHRWDGRILYNRAELDDWLRHR